jgi:hypothetical protein
MDTKKKPLSEILSEFLGRDLEEVKNIVSTMSLRDLVSVVNAIDDGDKETAFKIYSGYTV